MYICKWIFSTKKVYEELNNNTGFFRKCYQGNIGYIPAMVKAVSEGPASNKQLILNLYVIMMTLKHPKYNFGTM